MTAPDAARPAESVEIATLLKIIRDAYLYAIPTHSIVGVPEAILASDWFARSLAQARAEGAQAVVAAVEAAWTEPPDGWRLLDAARAAAQQAATRGQDDTDA
jgi:hypothetical protein